MKPTTAATPFTADAFKITLHEFRQAVALFPQEFLNTVPFEGSWTAGEVATHIIRSSVAILQTLSGKTKTTERAPDEKATAIRDLFLNFSIQLNSPDFILPAREEYQSDVVLEKLNTCFADLIIFAEKSDLELTCLNFDFPGSGPLTRLEWLIFVNVHCIRHIRQLNRIREKLNIKPRG